MDIFSISILIIFVILLFYFIYVYNYSLSLYQYCLSAKSNLSSYVKKMENIYQKVLNESIKGSEFEEQLLKSITKIRELKTDNPNLIKSEIENELIRFEAYPKINSQLLREKYQNEVALLEREIQNSTEVFNDHVVDYNTFIKSFPAIIFCKLLNRKSLDFID